MGRGKRYECPKDNIKVPNKYGLEQQFGAAGLDFFSWESVLNSDSYPNFSSTPQAVFYPQESIPSLTEMP